MRYPSKGFPAEEAAVLIHPTSDAANAPIELCRAVLSARGIPYSELVSANALGFTLELAGANRICCLLADGPARLFFDVEVGPLIAEEQMAVLDTVMRAVGSSVMQTEDGLKWGDSTYLPETLEETAVILDHMAQYAASSLAVIDIAYGFVQEGMSSRGILSVLRRVSWGEEEPLAN